MKKLKRRLGEAFDWLYMLWLKSLSDKEAEMNYIEAGARFGDGVSYLYFGEPLGFDNMFWGWARWEREYSRRGFRTLSLDDFVWFGGYGKALNGLGVKRAEGEKIILHSDIYKEEFLGKVRPVIDLKKIIETGKPQSAIFVLPGTKKND